MGKINKRILDQEAKEVIGEQFGVTAFFYGKMTVSDIKPQVDISTLIRSLRVQASFNIYMTARLISTETGALLWTDSVDRKGSLAYLSLDQGGIPYFDVKDQDETYRRIIEGLIYAISL